MEKDDEVKGNGNSYDFGARIYDPRIGRWASLDPLANKYPANSPYSFVANSPIAFIDPNGKENVIYLVVLPNASSKLTVSQMEEIVNKANEILSEKLGVKTEVRLYGGSDPFDPKNLDDTDSYIVLGSQQELIDASVSAPMYTGSGDRKELNAASARKLGTNNPENSDAGTKSGGIPMLNPGGLVQLEGSEGFAEELGEDKLDAIAFLIVHGASHNAYGAGHIAGTVLDKGDNIYQEVKYGPKTLEDFKKDTSDGLLKAAMELTYGTSEPQDNYEINKADE